MDRRALVLPVILSATFLYGFDFNVVNVAVPTLEAQLHAGPAALELVVGGYAFAYATGLVIGGRLGDLVGHRRMFLLGMAAFAVASASCGLAGSPGQLVAGRLAQGLAAAAMVPQVLALITTGFPAGQRPRALAWFGVTAAVAGVIGQVLGGLLLSADLFGWSWRPVFLVAVPLAVLALLVARAVLPRVPRAAGRVGLDPLGALGVSAALALALLPLALGREQGWPAWTWLSLAAAGPVLVAALAWERRLLRAGGAPLLDLRLFADRTFDVGLLVNAVFLAAFTSSVFVLSLLLQAGLGLSAVQAGLTFVPMAVLGMIAPLVGGRLVGRLGAPRVILVGSACSAAALAALAVLLDAFGAGLPVWALLPVLALLGVGNMLVLPAMIGATLAGVAASAAGVASGMLNTGQQFAGAAGLAVVGTVFFAVLGAPGPAAYAAATAVALWIDLGLVAALAALALLLARVARAPQPVGQP